MAKAMPERVLANILIVEDDPQQLWFYSRALRAAYVDALTDACRRLDVSVPPGARARAADVRQTDIYRMEAGLRARGFDVRETAQR